jgi:hypothetical protein
VLLAEAQAPDLRVQDPDELRSELRAPVRADPDVVDPDEPGDVLEVREEAVERR